LECVWAIETPCSKRTPDVGYLSKIPESAQPKEVLVLCSYWNPIGSCGLETKTDGRPREDRGDTELGSTKKCKATVRYLSTYGVLQKVYLRLCLDHRAYGKIFEEGCHIRKKSLDVLKEKMVTAPILVFSDWKKEFHGHVDASCIALGALPTQVSGEDLDHPIAFASRMLSKAEKNYSTTEREGLAMVYGLQKFRHYLLGGHFKMYTDHSALKYLVNKPVLGGGGESAGGSYCSRNMILRLL